MTDRRTELLAALANDMSRTASELSADWDGFSLVAETGALGLRVTGFSYRGHGAGSPMLVDGQLIDIIEQLRAASPGPNGEMFDIYVARLSRSAGEVVDQAFSAATGAAYRVTAANVFRIAELVRPESPFLPAAAPTPTFEPPVQAPPVQAPPVPAPPAQPVPPRPVQPSVPDVAPTFARPEPPAPPPPSAQPEPAPAPAAAPAPDPRDDALAALTRIIVNWPADGDWSSYGAAVAFRDYQSALGFRYLDGVATPTFVGGDFHRQLHDLREIDRQATGEAAGAILLRLVDKTQPVQARFVYGPQAQQISWSAADAVMAGRLNPAGGAATVAIRPDADLLDVTTILNRIKADVAASLRSRDRWRSFALGFDVAHGRTESYVYSDDGVPTAYSPVLSPEADIAELRRQSARPDGSMWAGAVVHAWPIAERVDVTFYGDAGIGAFLPAGSDGYPLRPPADPPVDVPAAPWPPTGGHLDPNALLASVNQHVLADPALADGSWDSVAVVIAFDGRQPTVSALRFQGGQASPVSITDAGPIGKFRRATVDSAGRWWDVCVLRGQRAQPGLSPEFRFSEQADSLRVDVDSIATRADELRPR